MRRYATGDDQVWERVERVWAHYADSMFPATYEPERWQGVAPPAGHPLRGSWAPPFRPFGPVGALLTRLWRVGARWPQ
eukprot:6053681-Lingulodinium_polyedra.AAC.1